MNHFKSLLAIGLVLILSSALLPGISNSARQFTVVRVSDGDTIKLRDFDSKSNVTVRLVGIDAPETAKGKRQPGQPFSRQATSYLASLVLNKTVDIREYGRDLYRRTLGIVYVNGTNVNLEIVKAGLAEVYRGRPPTGFDVKPYRQAENEARAAGRGMWSLRAQYVSPKDWRRMRRISQ